MVKRILIFLFLLTPIIIAGDYSTTFINAYKFDTANETITSGKFPTGSCHKFTLYNNIDATRGDSAITLTIEILASNDDTTYYIINDAGRFNKSVVYTSVDVIETFPIDIYGYNFIKVKATSYGCETSANYYTTTVKGIFSK